MRVCYFIRSHRDPEQVYRLARTLREGSSTSLIVVHHDYSQCELGQAPLWAQRDTAVWPRSSRQLRRTEYAGSVQPYLDLVDWLEREGIEYDWIVGLSAQDYPVKPVGAIEQFLENSSADGFLRFWDVLSLASPWSRRKARARYWHRYWRLPERFEPFLRATRILTKALPIHFYLDYGPYLGVRRLRTPFRGGFRCYGGWTWSTLRREAAVFLADFLARHSEIQRHYRSVMSPEESVVQTVLVNSGRFALINDDLRYIDYSHAVRGSPRTLTVADLPRLAAGRDHFARKFDLAVDREVLDRIDRELLGTA